MSVQYLVQYAFQSLNKFCIFEPLCFMLRFGEKWSRKLLLPKTRGNRNWQGTRHRQEHFLWKEFLHFKLRRFCEITSYCANETKCVEWWRIDTTMSTDQFPAKHVVDTKNPTFPHLRIFCDFCEVTSKCDKRILCKEVCGVMNNCWNCCVKCYPGKKTNKTTEDWSLNWAMIPTTDVFRRSIKLILPSSITTVMDPFVDWTYLPIWRLDTLYKVSRWRMDKAEFVWYELRSAHVRYHDTPVFLSNRQIGPQHTYSLSYFFRK